MTNVLGLTFILLGVLGYLAMLAKRWDWHQPAHRPRLRPYRRYSR